MSKKTNDLTLDDYGKFIFELKTFIKEQQYKALSQANRALIGMYWEIGKRIVEKQEKLGWGKGIVEKISSDLHISFPNMRGFSAQNLWRMRGFYLTYRDNKNLSPLVREISWTNNIIILGSTKGSNEREFYLKMCIKEKWSKRELQRQIDTDLFTRYFSGKKGEKALPQKTEDKLLPFKDHYVLEFLDIRETYTEKQLRKAILTRLRDFILEFGKNFAFVGEEYPVEAGGEVFHIDLLFYHRELRCLVPIELKIGKFKPEYVGKMEFYLNLLDEKIKLPDENPTIGLVLCKWKNNEVVRLTLSKLAKEVGVASYETRLPEKNIIEDYLHKISLPKGIKEDK